ncbi:hypothetical protein C0W54_13050 [Photobacterium kishitanii]|uniref:hypothetical protein n=1 Tax=Photobacterium kishitanii TaxID=318456 RepID=UPI000D179B07|nr:hypothetical protein [Photobacterium kishitanii]PSW60865.1 hypothetical protein C0W54_13050 [Photobacterium kishitanii]
MIIGVSKVDIIPSMPMKLAGFDFRRGHYEKVGMPIFCRCLVFEQKIALISLELLFIGDYLDALIRDKIATYKELKKLNLQLSATHSHSSMQSANNHSPRLGEFSATYCEDVANKVITAIKQALLNQEIVTVNKAITSCDIAIYRRVINTKGKIEMAPNSNVEIDKSAHIFQFIRKDGTTKAILIHNHCHPTVSADNILSGEYPGVVCHQVEATYANSVCLFLQGFCGDIRPNLCRDNQFYRAHFDEIIRIGTSLASRYLKAIKTSIKIKEESVIVYSERMVFLPLNKPQNWFELEEYKKSQAQDDIHFEWAVHQQGLLNKDAIKSNNSQQQIKLCFLNINNILKFIMINAEVVNHYQHYITKNIDSSILGVGYCNGMIGYIPTQDQIIQGGYEPDLSSYYFYLPATFTQHVESCLKQALNQIIDEN